MKKILLIVFGVILIFTVGLFWFFHWVFVGFEYREDHNGVGWSAFAQSVRKHVKSGPYEVNEFGHYEGKVYFTVTDDEKNDYHLFTSRGAYSDARNMHTLKSAKLRVKKINGQNLVCNNNFGEDVFPFISRENLLLSNETPNSLNEMLEASRPVVSSFGVSLPQSYSVLEGKVVGIPEGFLVNVERHSNCCSKGKLELEPAASISCRLE